MEYVNKKSLPVRKKQAEVRGVRNPLRGRPILQAVEKSLNQSIRASENGQREWIGGMVPAHRVKSASQSRHQSPAEQKEKSQSPAGIRHQRMGSDGRPTSSQQISKPPSRVHSASGTPKRGTSLSFIQLKAESHCEIRRKGVSHRRNLSLELRPSADCASTTGRNSSTEPQPFALRQNEDNSLKAQREKLRKYLKNYYIQKHAIPTTSSDYYHFLKLIGKGAFGKVSLAIHKLTGLHVAIKSLDKAYIRDDRTRRKVFNEVINMRKVTHLHVVRLLEVFESSRHFNMVMEYCGGGDLLHFVRTRGKVPESEAKLIFHQVTEAVAACHSQDVIHRDVKLDNVLMDSAMTTVKLCDFGVSRNAVRGQRINDQCGTPAYIAPEIIVDCGYDGFYVDLWSMGVLLYAMVVGTVPFRASTLPDLHKLILKGKYTMPGTLSVELQHLISGLLQLLPQNRLQLEDVLSHPWFAQTGEETEVAEGHACRFLGRICSHDCNPSLEPVDNRLLSHLDRLGLSGEYAWHCLRLHEINHATATYELLKLAQN